MKMFEVDYSACEIERSIHTEMYSDKAYDILYRMRVYIATKWGSTQMVRNAFQSSINFQPNGEITWDIYKNVKYKLPGQYYEQNHYSSRTTYACRRDDQKVREWMCMVLKRICFNEFEAEAKEKYPYGTEKRSELIKKFCSKRWSRKNNDVVASLSGAYIVSEKNCNNREGDITVADVYCMYDKLLNRKRLMKQWPKAMLSKLVGDERDPAATQLEVIHREELKKLEEKHAADDAQLRKQESYERFEAVKSIEDKYRKLREKELAAYLKAKEDLNASLSFMTMIG